MKKILTAFIAFFLVFGMLSCANQTTDDGKVIVAVSIVPQAAFVEAVAGDLVDIITLIPPGYSPANYEPNAQTMAELSNASVYFTIGVPTESGNILPDIDEINVVHLEDIVSESFQDRYFGESRDPHIWLSIQRVKVMVQAIADELSRIDPTNEVVYQANSAGYLDLLDDVDAQIQTIFEDLTMTTFIVFHPSYGYFADEYGLTMVALEEDGKEATIQHLNDVIDLADTLDIHTVFYQIEVDSSQVDAFADSIDGTAVSLNPLAEDYLGNLIEMATRLGESFR